MVMVRREESAVSPLIDSVRLPWKRLFVTLAVMTAEFVAKKPTPMLPQPLGQTPPVTLSLFCTVLPAMAKEVSVPMEFQARKLSSIPPPMIELVIPPEPRRLSKMTAPS